MGCRWNLGLWLGTGCSDAANNKVVKRYRALAETCVANGKPVVTCNDIYMAQCQEDAHWKRDLDAETTDCEGVRLPEGD